MVVCIAPRWFGEELGRFPYAYAILDRDGLLWALRFLFTRMSLGPDRQTVSGCRMRSGELRLTLPKGAYPVPLPTGLWKGTLRWISHPAGRDALVALHKVARDPR